MEQLRRHRNHAFAVALGWATTSGATTSPLGRAYWRMLSWDSSNSSKIGLTRRLEPTERIAELSGASVPFRFDIHTLYFSEDAVTLENELHKQFAARALNQANPRKEFLFATPAEVRDVLTEKVGNLLEFSEYADATEFLQSINLWPARPSLGPAAEAQPHDT